MTWVGRAQAVTCTLVLRHPVASQSICHLAGSSGVRGQKLLLNGVVLPPSAREDRLFIRVPRSKPVAKAKVLSGQNLVSERLCRPFTGVPEAGVHWGT